MSLLTVGHGRLGRTEFVALLGSVEAESIVDVRRFPRSSRNPDMNLAAMTEWLPAAGIDYRHDVSLGGRRRLAAGASVEDPWWRVAQFAAYAAHTRTAAFQEAIQRLLQQSSRSRTAIMCSESLWWRCHRRLIADVAVLRYDRSVLHVMPDGHLSPHAPAAGARLSPDGLVYWDSPPPDPES
ncbi:DUF488 family protein [Rhodococcus sp. ACT016]|uniref:DUF488 domain-containing protein n=1 Tax=Rhodococcus sp. ACT016 TaxID=3134808 RepID=UPI003D2DF48B